MKATDPLALPGGKRGASTGEAVEDSLRPRVGVRRRSLVPPTTAAVTAARNGRRRSSVFGSVGRSLRRMMSSGEAAGGELAPSSESEVMKTTFYTAEVHDVSVSNAKAVTQLFGRERRSLWERILTGRQQMARMLATGFVGLLLDIVNGLFSLAAIVLFVIEMYTGPNDSLFWIEVWLTLAFTIDYLLRLLSAPRPVAFAFSTGAIADLLSILPIVIELAWEESAQGLGRFLVLLRILRVFRIFRFHRLLSYIEDEISGLVAQMAFTVGCIIFVSASLVRVLEQTELPSFKERDIDLPFHIALYFVVTTVSTVGYGDVTVQTDQGRVVVMLMMVSFLVMIPHQTNRLVTLLSARSVHARAAFKSSVPHVVIFCSSAAGSVSAFVKELFHPDHGVLELQAVFVAQGAPKDDMQYMLNEPRFIGRCIYLDGDCLLPRTLTRARLSTALAVFVLSNGPSVEAGAEDALTILRSLALARWLRLRDLQTPLYIQFNRRESKDIYNSTAAFRSIKLSAASSAAAAGADDDGTASGDGSRPSTASRLRTRFASSRRAFGGSSSSSRSALVFPAAAAGDGAADGLLNDTVVPGFGSVVCVDELKMSLLALSCRCPGVIALVSNLVSSMSLPTTPPRPWLREYVKGCSYEIYRVPLSPALEGMRVSQVAQITHEYTGALLFALDVKHVVEEALPRRILLFPGAYVLHDVRAQDMHAYIICEDQESAEAVSGFADDLVDDGTPASEIADTIGELGGATPGSERGRRGGGGSSGEPAGLSPKSRSAAAAAAAGLTMGGGSSGRRSSHFKRGSLVEEAKQVQRASLARRLTMAKRKTSAVYTTSSDRLAAAASAAAVASSLSRAARKRAAARAEADTRAAVAAAAAKAEAEAEAETKEHPAGPRVRRLLERYHLADSPSSVEAAQVSSIEQDLPGLAPHILVVGRDDLVQFVLPLRSKHLSFVQPIVLLVESRPSALEWARYSCFAQVYYVIGSPLESADLERAGVMRASRVVLLAKPPEAEAQSATGSEHDGALHPRNRLALRDADVVFVHRLVTALNSKVRVFTELSTSASMQFLSSSASAEAVADAEHCTNPEFAAGSVYVSSVVETLLCGAFFNPRVIDVIEQLLHGPEFETETAWSEAAPKELKGAVDSKLYQVHIPARFVGGPFHRLFTELTLKQDVLPIALLRGPSASSSAARGSGGGGSGGGGSDSDSDAALNDNTVPYVYTNPGPETELAEADRLFILAAVSPAELEPPLTVVGSAPPRPPPRISHRPFGARLLDVPAATSVPSIGRLLGILKRSDSMASLLADSPAPSVHSRLSGSASHSVEGDGGTEAGEEDEAGLISARSLGLPASPLMSPAAAPRMPPPPSSPLGGSLPPLRARSLLRSHSGDSGCEESKSTGVPAASSAASAELLHSMKSLSTGLDRVVASLDTLSARMDRLESRMEGQTGSKRAEAGEEEDSLGEESSETL